MSLYIRHTENKQIRFLVPFQTTNGTACVDITDRAWNAIRQDRKAQHKDEQGPNFGIEILHAREFAGSLAHSIPTYAIHKFTTRDGRSVSELNHDIDVPGEYEFPEVLAG